MPKSEFVIAFETYLTERRRALLKELDSIEKMLKIEPRTASLRKEEKRGRFLTDENTDTTYDVG